MTLKTARLNGIIQRELTDIFAHEVKDKKLGFMTITGVDVTRDLSYAKVYVTFLGKKYKSRDGMAALERCNGYVRTLLARRLTTRKVPQLRFVLDTSLEYGNHIDSILEDMKEDGSV